MLKINKESKLNLRDYFKKEDIEMIDKFFNEENISSSFEDLKNFQIEEETNLRRVYKFKVEDDNSWWKFEFAEYGFDRDWFKLNFIRRNKVICWYYYKDLK